MLRPNFFILGAPKCGTTSMSEWLSRHPGVCFSPVKEPNFFNSDHRVGFGFGRTIRNYEGLFRNVTSKHHAIGEASVWYLYSEVAVPDILKYSPAARFVIMLRNPVEMAYSLHQQQVFNASEHIDDFEKAWRAQSLRSRERWLPWQVEPKQLLYGPVCNLGTQVDRLFRLVGKDRVLAVVFDDLQNNPSREYSRVLEFLGLPDDGRIEFPLFNPSKVRRSVGTSKIVQLCVSTRKALGIPTGTGIGNFVDRLNKRELPRKPMTIEFRREIVGFFQKEVTLLEGLLGRSFNHWICDRQNERGQSGSAKQD